MAELTVSYKFFSLEPAEVKIEHGKYPLDSIVPFGPPHHNEGYAMLWLKEHAEHSKQYILLPLYANLNE